MMHFRREKYVSRGGPDGGDGGRGGDVVLVAKATINTLASFRRKTRFIAMNGGNGAVQKQTGRSASELVIYVPTGTIVYDLDSGELIGDLVAPDQRLVVCKGGRAGRGNIHFATSRNQAPRTAEKGAPGEERNLHLELKLIADVGLIGVPNAGKSSFLAAVTNAKPKIADYPFTTLEPNLGVVDLDLETSLVLADIPGLIEGAHQGVGLGDAFLRHIQRTRVLIHLIDGLAEDPIADFTQINSELALFDPELAEKPQIVAFNKMDLPDVEQRWPEVKAELESRNIQPVAISALARKNLKPILWQALDLVRSMPEPGPVDGLPVYRMKEDPREFLITMYEDGFRVQGEAIERAAQMTYWEYVGSVRRFQRLMENLGVDDALREAGVREGNTVYIGEYELDWKE
ncbi:MAG: GTPase ObgE [Anaerolineaceae bacterium]|nr:GTPase ObgE [Anaerolineaceae bacterium]